MQFPMGGKQTTTLLLTFILMFGVSSCLVFTETQESDLRNFIEVVMRCKKIPGMTVSVVKGNETWTSGFGQADMETGEPVTENTLFGIGSIGKSFTAALVGMALRKNGLYWNTTLQDIPGANYKFVTETMTREATVADLLSHKTGLSSVMDVGFIGGYPEKATRQLLADRLQYLPAQYQFRKTFHYNNMMYMVLGHLLEVLTEERWEEAMFSKLFEPLGMDSSRTILSSEDVLGNEMAKPYIYKDGEFQPGTKGVYRIHPLEPAGSVLSNAVDMAKWMRFNLRLGKTEDGKVLIDEDFFSEAFRTQISTLQFAYFYDLRSPPYPITDLTLGYGYAWFTSTYRGHPRYWHSGGMFSYVSLIQLFPNEQLGIFGNVNGPATNKDPGNAIRVILAFIADLLLGYDPWLNPETGCDFPSPWVNGSSFNPPPPPPPVQFDDEEYTGKYANQILPEITISKRNGESLDFKWGHLSGILHPTDKADEFRMETTGFFEFAIEKVVNENYTSMYSVTFNRTEDGEEVQGFRLLYVSVSIEMIKGFDFLTGDYYIAAGYAFRPSVSVLIGIALLALVSYQTI